MRNAIEFDSLSPIAMCIALNTKLLSTQSANNVFRCVLQIVSSVLSSRWNELSETDQTLNDIVFLTVSMTLLKYNSIIASVEKIAILILRQAMTGDDRMALYQCSYFERVTD